MNPYPDNPVPVSVDFLKKLDADPPGTWLAQPKLDGWRRIIHFDHGTWIAQAKRGSEGHLKSMPEIICRELDKIAQEIDGESWDCEWMGNRCKGDVGAHTLHPFDVLRHNGEWLRDMPFASRYQRASLVQTSPNPGLLDLFQQQMQDPLSEGLVVRRADSKLILNPNKCADNPLWFKVKYRNIKEKCV